jgi:hypothetical protein
VPERHWPADRHELAEAATALRPTAAASVLDEAIGFAVWVCGRYRVAVRVQSNPGCAGGHTAESDELRLRAAVVR